MMGPDLLGRLIDEHAAALVLYARQWCAAPEDVVQDAFVKLVRQKQPPDKALSWLYRVVRNAAIDASRAAERRRRHESKAAAHAPSWFCPAERSEIDAETASQALQTLPMEQREVIVAHLWGGLTFEQIGELIGASSSTAHRWYLAGLAALRDKLGVACPTKTSIRNC
ncbi:MAG TPA: sigma-70 family RNA polymerase sigma factor [Gemmataceae bacterium]|jgi:RNA polymerase sigma-70 factor (ECF subfamily)|nr:sigma-70 family RNA polymerase sigma factor [Gemmataceae bacterium]